MKTYCHHAVEAAIKKCGYTMDQVDGILNKSKGWTWLVLQGKPSSPSLLNLLPDFYKIIKEKCPYAAINLAAEIFKTPDFKYHYLDGFEDGVKFLSHKMRVRETT